MSLDYPFYEELARKQHRGAKWWRVGDYLYYVGILVALAGLMGAFTWLVTFAFGEAVLSAWWAMMFPCGLLVFAMGSSMKGYSYELARRDGLSTEY